MGSGSVGGISRPEGKLILGGSASRTWRNSLVTSREVPHATTSASFGKWLVRAMLVRAIQSLNRGMSHAGRGAISFAGEQFWGWGVQVCSESLDRGRFLFATSFPKSPSFHLQTIALAYNELPSRVV